MDSHAWTVRLTSKEPGAATAHARRHSFDIGAPLSFDEQHGRVTAFEYLLAAAAADVMNGLSALARDRRVAVNGIEAVATGEVVSAMRHLGVVGATGTPALARVRVRVYVDSPAPADTIEALWNETLARSVLAGTLGNRLVSELKLS